MFPCSVDKKFRRKQKEDYFYSIIGNPKNLNERVILTTEDLNHLDTSAVTYLVSGLGLFKHWAQPGLSTGEWVFHVTGLPHSMAVSAYPDFLHYGSELDSILGSKEEAAFFLMIQPQELNSIISPFFPLLNAVTSLPRFKWVVYKPHLSMGSLKRKVFN